MIAAQKSMAINKAVMESRTGCDLKPIGQSLNQNIKEGLAGTWFGVAVGGEVAQESDFPYFSIWMWASKEVI